MLAIETVDLTRKFGNLTAVDTLNLQIPAGSLYGLIGPNGAGKTTTLRMLAGLLDPSNGEIHINGFNSYDDWQKLRFQIGYMPDFFGVYEDMLVWEYLDFFARCYDLPKQRRSVVIKELLDLVDLTEKRDDYVQSLSRGMRQRLCLAHTLVHDPAVILLDEPASGLDPRARVEMRALLRELRAMGKTILVSSHILAELSEMCDSIGILESGRLITSGPVGDISHQLKQGHIIHIKAISEHEKLIRILKIQPEISSIYPLDDGVDIEFTGDELSASKLLTTLITAGLQITTFAETSSGLEDIFLRLTKGDIA